MSFFTGTQTELLYAMPAAGPAVTATGSVLSTSGSVLSLNTSTAPGLPYLLPASFFTQQSGGGPGKSLLIKGGGWFTLGSTADTLTFGLFFDTTAGTAATLIAQTGAVTPAVSVTNGAWEFEILLTCAALATGAHTLLNGVGHLFWGPANNAAAPTFSSAGVTNGAGVVMIGAPQSGALITSTTGYFVEPFALWSASTGSPTLTMTNFMIFGLN